MERSYLFFLGVLAILAGLSLWSQHTELAAERSRAPAEATHAVKNQPLEIERVDLSKP